MHAIILMVVSMGLLATTDLFVKLASAVAPTGQIMLFLSLGGTAVFIALARLRGIPLLTRDAVHPMLLWRNLTEMIAAVGMIVGVSHTSLPVFAAITQAGPLVVTLGAALFLKETVGWRRWLAVIVGLIGVLIVIRPWGSQFTGWELFAVMGISALSARDLITRMSPARMHPITISTWGFAATIVPAIGLLAIGNWQIVNIPYAWLMIAGAVIVTTAGYLAITTAMRLAPASEIAPFRYTRLIYSIIFGIIFFADYPDFWTLVGATLILSAGFYSFMRERRLARQTPPASLATVSVRR